MGAGSSELAHAARPRTRHVLKMVTAFVKDPLIRTTHLSRWPVALVDRRVGLVFRQVARGLEGKIGSEWILRVEARRRSQIRTGTATGAEEGMQLRRRPDSFRPVVKAPAFK